MAGLVPAIRVFDSRCMDPNSPASQRAFFGRRKGHPLKPRQQALFDALLPRLALDLGAPAPVNLRTLFAIPVDDVRLEIGFGGAEHLIAQARARPTTGFIGTDAFVNAMAKALVAIEDNALANIRLYFGDASELLDWLPNASLSRIDLLYPDPWPKRRHWKRRFIQDETLARLTRLLRQDGELRFATDIADYAAYALARVLRSPGFVWTAQCADDWREPWPDFVETRYEAKAKREGRRPTYFIFRRV
ncbi:MAG TPA: tRNA (guanine(46)-N(7))-methyltransferase TrmB [Pseudolabrys sp.]|nr:tRNA (guanine(46)-N(7))-methyltransferase TrmB [Pseudolabrys sp.]